MAGQYQLAKSFNSFRGLDLRSSDLNRDPNFASDLVNVDYRKSGAMSKRKGYKATADDAGGFGLGVYSEVDTTTGAITERLLTVDANLHELTNGSIVITYSGSDDAYLDLYLSSDGNFYLDLYDDNVRVLNTSLKSGRDEASPITLAALKTTIDAVTDFAASITGSTTADAAHLPIKRNLTISTTATLTSTYWTEVSKPTNAPNPFVTAQTKTGEDDFENATFANINGVVYIATGYDELYKFDGTRVYRAGLPKPATAGTLNLVAGSVTDTNIKYIYTYEYTDAKGNIIESIPSDESATVSPTSQNIEVTVSNIQDTTGFDTDSTDLKIRLYRTTAGGTTFNFVKEVTNDGTTATQVITDDVVTGSLGAEYVTPVKEHGLPPKGKYLTVIQGLLVIGGDNTSVNTVYYSDIDSPEYFPAGDNSFTVESAIGDKVSGIAPQGNVLFVFKDKSIYSVSGTINEDTFRVDLMDNSDVGCAAHATIREINGTLTFLSTKGVFGIGPGDRSVQHLSERIDNLFTRFDAPYNFKKAVAENWRDKDKYLLFMPVPEANGSDPDVAGSESIVFTWDYYRDAWLKWDSINAFAGLAVIGNTLYFSERRVSALTSNTAYYLYSFLDSGDTWDYADHDSSISIEFKSHWEAAGEPSVFKKFLRLKLHGLETSIDDFESTQFSIDLVTEKDYIDTTHSSTTLDFSGGDGWGIDAWGAFSWGNDRLITKKTKLRSGKAKSIRIILKNNNLHENILVSGYELEMVTPYQPALKE